MSDGDKMHYFQQRNLDRMLGFALAAAGSN